MDDGTLTASTMDDTRAARTATRAWEACVVLVEHELDEALRLGQRLLRRLGSVVGPACTAAAVQHNARARMTSGA